MRDWRGGEGCEIADSPEPYIGLRATRRLDIQA